MDITTATQTVAVLRTDYQFISIFMENQIIVFDPVKLGEIVNILQENDINVDEPLHNIEEITKLKI